MMTSELSAGKAVIYGRVQAQGVKLVLERGVALSQASKDLGLHVVNVLRKWVADPKGRGRQRHDDAEVSRLRHELAKNQSLKRWEHASGT